MQIKTIEYKDIDEKVHIYEHKSGLKAFVIPKKGYSKKYATFATHYGSINSEFIIPGESDITKVPDGIAHFLEHKLFEQKDGSVMNKFSNLGSNPNAYTGFNQTVYLFSSTDRFNDNFQLLLDFVQNPYITEESVENEKGIIGQEINMKADEPEWRLFFNLLDALYKNNPVKIEIAGTKESISKINKDILYTCYNTFYHPSNMIILVVGDVDAEEVFKQVEASIVVKEELQEIKRIFPDEIKTINKPYIEEKLAVSTPMFMMGFRDNYLDNKGLDSIRREIAVKLLLELIMGRSSKLYNQMYNEGLINNTFDFDYTNEEQYAFTTFGGESDSPERVKDMILGELEKINKQGLDRESYERIKRSMTGKFIKSLNSVERISHSFISVYFKGVILFDYFDVYDKITFEYVKEVYQEHFKEENLAVSVIRPN
jgi:predicted Zn-dependent peptidase